MGKGSKERMVYLNDACIDALNKYLEIRTADPKAQLEPALFISNQRKRISKRRNIQPISTIHTLSPNHWNAN